MKGQVCGPIACCASVPLGVMADDFAALDELAVKLICLDRSFAAPLRQMGRIIGERIAGKKGERMGLDAALSALIPACGLESVIESRFLHRNADGARLELTGCAEALGWQVPNVERTVCGFDAGLFEGFLHGATGDESLKVEETACLGFGHPSCEFLINRERGLERSAA